MGQHVTVVVILHPDMVKATSIGDFNLHDHVRTRTVLASFNKRHTRTSLDFHNMMDNGIRTART